MPREVGQFIDNNFVRGLVTEATGLTFPENACTETFDCIFKKTGEVTRRKGFEYEASYSLFTLTAARDKSAISSFRWTGAGGDGNSSFICLQVGQYIYFYAIGDSLSAEKHSTSINLDSFDVSGSIYPFSYPVSFAQGDGKLFVVGQFIEPFYVTYTPSTDTISSGTQITIKIRDFEGITADNISGIKSVGRQIIDEYRRPNATVTSNSGTGWHDTNDGAIVNAHLYNLMNQGWGQKVYTDTPGQENPVLDWDAAETTLPGNSDRWWQLKNAEDQMDMAELDKYPVLSSRAPKGAFIFNAFNIDRTGVYGTSSAGSGLPIDFDTLWGRAASTYNASDLYSTSTDYRPSSVAFYGNRVWYAGVSDEGYSSNVYFSQILSDISNAGRCYQEQDPTSETFSDLLPTDGGVVEIPGIANIVYMQEAQNALIIWATNGIWKVTGSEGIGFTASDFAVNKISNLQNVDNQSFVDLNGTPAWITAEGIWILQQDQTLGSQEVTSISKDSIQTFFGEIPESSIPFIKGEYNAQERLVYWLYKSTEGSTTDSKYEYDRCLVFNTETGAFYPWKLNTDSDIKVIGIAVSTGFSREASEVAVVAGADTVVDSVAAAVTEDVLTDTSVSGTMKLLVENSSDQITWAEQYDTDYLDWTTAKGTGKAYTSYFITGYKVRGGGLKKQKSNYVRIHSRIEPNSGVLVQGVWDYYTSDGARWSIEQQGYKTGTNQTYSERRLKIRGQGLALQLRFASEAGKPFNIIGWATEDSTNQKP